MSDWEVNKVSGVVVFMGSDGFFFWFIDTRKLGVEKETGSGTNPRNPKSSRRREKASLCSKFFHSFSFPFFSYSHSFPSQSPSHCLKSCFSSQSFPSLPCHYSTPSYFFISMCISNSIIFFSVCISPSLPFSCSS